MNESDSRQPVPDAWFDDLLGLLPEPEDRAYPSVIKDIGMTRLAKPVDFADKMADVDYHCDGCWKSRVSDGSQVYSLCHAVATHSPVVVWWTCA